MNALSAVAGGGWTYLVNVLEELNRDSRDIEFTFLVTNDKAPSLKQYAGSHCRIVGVRKRNAALRIAWEQVRLPMLARRFDALYCVADIAPVWKTTPTAVLLRNLNIYDRTYYRTLRLRWMDQASRLGLNRAAAILFPSESAANEISRIVGIDRSRTHVVPHGIQTSRFEAASESVVETRRERRFILIPAAVERHKNIEIAIDALSLCEDRTLRIRIAGNDRSDPEYTEELIRRAEEKRVLEQLEFLGPVAYDEMTRLYLQSGVALLPSHIETFGHPMLEAMASGTPLAVPDLPIFHEIAGDAAWYFGPHDSEGLAGVLTAILSAPEQAEARVSIGRDRVETFSWRASVDKLCEALKSIRQEEGA